MQPQHRIPQSHPHTQTPRLLRPVPLHTGLICQPSRLHLQTTDPEQPIPKLHSHPRRRLQRQPTKHPPRPSHLHPHIGQRRHRHPTLHPQLGVHSELGRHHRRKRPQLSHPHTGINSLHQGRPHPVLPIGRCTSAHNLRYMHSTKCHNSKDHSPASPPTPEP